MKKTLLLSLMLTTLALPVWQMGAQTAGHATQELLGAGTYTWTAPANVTALGLELWGAGGGGTENFSSARSGNGGGSGAYVRHILTVVPGQTYLITVGAGGAGDTGSGSGSAGGTTEITDVSGTRLLFAGGGGGATKIPDTAGAAGVPDPSAGIKRPGHKGSKSHGISGNQGGASVQGSVEAPYFIGGGAGGNSRGTAPGQDGGDGYAILFW
jgi:hypothetical protein